MPYQEYTLTTIDALLSDLNTFSAANGWTVDLFGTYLSHNRLHIHRGDVHCEFWYNGTDRFNMRACRGYSSGNIPTAQPGDSGLTSQLIIAATSPYYAFIDAGDALYIGGANTAWSWAGVGEIPASFDSVADAAFVSIGTFLTPTSYTKTAFFYNAAWTPIVAAGGACGNISASTEITGAQPSEYNAGILPLKVTLFIRKSDDSTKMQPIGYAPGIMKFSAGSVYVRGEEITIGAETWVAMPNGAAECGTSDLLFLV